MRYTEKYMTVRINTHGNPLPKQYGNGDWIDLSAAENCIINPGEYREISLGISMELPEGTFAMVVPRSSTYKKYHIILANSVGIIDQAYKGDNDIWRFPALNVSNTASYIAKGDRIAQFMIFNKGETVAFDKVDSLGNVDRGGIGSTGK